VVKNRKKGQPLHKERLESSQSFSNQVNPGQKAK
jgi:hypothetical protein